MNRDAENAKSPGYSVRVWISREDIRHFQDLAEVTGLTQTELQTRVMHAGIEALAGRTSLTLPLRFAVSEEPKPSKK